MSRRKSGTESWVGRELEVDLDRVAHGGHCVGRAEGRVVFVRHGLPGERVLVSITEDGGGSFCRGDAVEILVTAPGRVEAPCPYAGPGLCGGCDWQHADGSTQRNLKSAVVAEQLSRIAGIDVLVTVEAVEGGLLDWRTRMQYAVDAAGRPGLRRSRSHEIVKIDTCLIADPRARDRWILDRTWPNMTGVEVEVGDEGPAVVRTIDGHKRHAWVSGSAHVTTHAAGERSWRVTGGGFWQVHPAAADTLVDCVVRMLVPEPGESVLDLYSGVGLFGGVLGQIVGQTGRVLCLESVGSAVSDGIRNLADLPHVEMRQTSVNERVVSGLTASTPGGVSFDLVVLDPPRSGAKAATCAAIAALNPRKIAYVACDPAALARDLSAFAEHGYELSQIRAFDLYPMTHHVETVALLVPR